MKYNLYDFDGTIYDGNSTLDFIKFCQDKQQVISKDFLFKVAFNYLKLQAHLISESEFIEIMFSFLNDVDNIDRLVEEFWLEHKNKIKSFYIVICSENDIIISAGPRFLIEPIYRVFNIKDLIATDIDKNTGKLSGIINHGKAKVKNFNAKYPDATIARMFTDRMSDKPLLKIAREGYVVKGDTIYDYEAYDTYKEAWGFLPSIKIETLAPSSQTTSKTKPLAKISQKDLDSLILSELEKIFSKDEKTKVMQIKPISKK